jgi:DNA polymerase-1
MPGVGPKRARVALVGEAPGAQEDRRGKPFVGPSGELLDLVLGDIGWSRKELFITNAVRCRPPGNKLKAQNTQACQGLLLEELASLPNLEFVVTFGNEALWGVTGKRGITAERGIPRQVQVGGKQVTLVPVFHPAYVLRDQARMGDFLTDMETAARTLKEGVCKPATSVLRMLETKEQWVEFLASLGKPGTLLAYDIETNCLKPWMEERPVVLGVSFSIREGEGWFAPLDHFGAVGIMEGQEGQIREVLEDATLPKVDHNGQFDTRFLATVLGIKVRGVVFDTAIAYHMLEEEDSASGGGALDGLAARHTPLGAYKKIALEGAGRDALQSAPLPVVARYAAMDADATQRLAWTFRRRLEQEGIPDSLMVWELRKRDLLASMERRGAFVDWEYHKECLRKFPERVRELDAELMQFPAVVQAAKGEDPGVKQADFLGGSSEPFNPNSDGQLKFLCLKVLALAPVGDRLTDGGMQAKKEGRPLTYKHYKADTLAFDYWLAEESLDGDARKILELIQERRQTSRIFSTFIAPLGELKARDGRIHSSFNGSRMVTWRVSSSEPNLQNLPRALESFKSRPCGPNDVKRLYSAPPGWKIVAADYSQLELRIIALLSQDQSLLSAFNTGEDVHKKLAAKLYQKPLKEVTKEERSNAKPGNFGCAYLMSAQTLAMNFRLPRALADRLHAAFWSEYCGYANYVEERKEEVLATGKARSLFGHVRHLPNVRTSDRGEREGFLRIGVNFPVQCTASNLCLYAQALIEGMMRDWSWQAFCFLNVHDSIVIAAPEEEVEGVAELLRTVMEGMPFDWLYGTKEYPQTCPIKADIDAGPNLRDLEPLG